MVNTNPYETPRELSAEDELELGQSRQAARRDVRTALIVLLLPATYNMICFNFSSTFAQIPFPIQNLYRVTNFVGYVLVVSGVWLFGLVALEMITRAIHAIASRWCGLDAWKAELYESLHRAPRLAVLGAVLWAIWVFAFYQLGVHFFVVSVPIGIGAHLVAACLYLPLLYRWYRIESQAKPQST